MNHLKLFKAILSIVLLVFAGSTPSASQTYNQWVMNHWSKNKDSVFNAAKAEDKLVLLFVGRPTCTACKDMSEMLCNPDNPYKEILDENYITLYKWYDDENDRADVFEYIEDLYYEREVLKQNRQIPWLFIIDPTKEWECVVSSYRPYQDYRPNEEIMKNFLIDFKGINHLSWYVGNEKIVFEVAKEQNKHILKYIGNGSSPNGQLMMLQFHEEPLRPLLEEHFILWFFYEEDECGCEPLPGDGEEDVPPELLPRISIIDPFDPENVLEEFFGLKDIETLENLFLKYPSSNEKITPKHLVTVAGDKLILSTPTPYEQINIYSLSGSRITTVRKNDYTLQIDISSAPKGILIVHSSAGWSAKIVVK